MDVYVYTYKAIIILPCCLAAKLLPCWGGKVLKLYSLSPRLRTEQLKFWRYHSAWSRDSELVSTIVLLTSHTITPAFETRGRMSSRIRQPMSGSSCNSCWHLHYFLNKNTTLYATYIGEFAMLSCWRQWTYLIWKNSAQNVRTTQEFYRDFVTRRLNFYFL